MILLKSDMLGTLIASYMFLLYVLFVSFVNDIQWINWNL